MNYKVALITGVSGPREMGTAICRELAESGFDIFFTHYGADALWLKAFEEELIQKDVRCKHMSINLASKDAASEVMMEASKVVGPPSVLINNAAHSERDGWSELSSEELDLHYAVNMRSPFLLCTEFVKSYEKAELKEGRIIFMTSGQDLGPMPEELAYSATKGAISAFARTLAAELAHKGITVNAINPGPTDSTWMNDDIRAHILPKFPTGRIGMPQDAANLIGFLVSEKGGWITGQILHSEGGFMR
ncbi:SDR family oxidoreductase [Bacillus lacus]|uniref:SDR family oxidoreductase n=1 Tax=Metabacillus lacus TaxID=1983721 RepID=A0A7X2M0L9_9BACI|nr:SDR family oxidoreductase [Metabacillus lacus]MRX74333.1 SDR family oxidoreductase [Metabacillus lacus]